KVQTQTHTLALKASLASYFGSALDFYDFLVFGFVASTIAPLFFPSSYPVLSLLYTFATFAVGFALRPVGAIVFGHFGDKKLGRRNTLIITILMMGVVCVAMGLLPTYQQIGILAPVGMVTLRLLQGFALGGEFGGGATFTAESAPPRWRGFYVGILQMSNNSLISVAVLSYLTSTLTHPQFVAYGWRIMFLIGIVIALAGLILRLWLVETPVFEVAKDKGDIARIPIGEVLKNNWRQVIQAIGFSIAATVSIYTVSVFAVSYLATFIHVSTLTASNVVLIGSVVLLVLTPITGIVADRVGRKPLLIACWGSLLVWTYPFFKLISTGNFTDMVLGFVVYYALFSLSSAAGVTAVTELFPTRVRYTAVSFVYHLNTGLFGGLTPLLATYLIVATHYNLAPMYWLLTAIAISFIASITLKESKGRVFTP
ncbi:MAG: MFS transporter, partial [Conexivisphaerales archaeon]